MWEVYRDVVDRYPPITLETERELIAKAQAGVRKSRDELILRHVGFVIFRLRKKVYPQYLRRYGEELLSAALPVLIAKIDVYDLAYRDAAGRPKPVRFVSYIWKRIDGAIVDCLKALLRVDLAERGFFESEREP